MSVEEARKAIVDQYRILEGSKIVRVLLDEDDILRLDVDRTDDTGLTLHYNVAVLDAESGDAPGMLYVTPGWYQFEKGVRWVPSGSAGA